MNDRSPCRECALSCRHYDSPMCVSNLVMLTDENAPITLGLHVALNHVYAEDGLPPCVRGTFGSAHWSILPHAKNSGCSAAQLDPGPSSPEDLNPSNLITPASEAGFHPMVLIPSPG